MASDFLFLVLRAENQRQARSGSLRTVSETVRGSAISNLSGIVYCETIDHRWTMEHVSDGPLEQTGYRREDLTENQDLPADPRARLAHT